MTAKELLLKILKWIGFDRALFTRVLLCTIIVGLLVHGYSFLNFNYSGDAICELSGNPAMGWKVLLGRFGQVFYWYTRGHLPAPWLCGLLSLLWLALGNYVVLRVLKIRSRLLSYALCGVLTTSISLSILYASAMHDSDSYMLAYLLAALAAYALTKYRRGYLLACPLIIATLSLYQAYFSVTLTLCLLSSILALLDGRPAKEILRSLFKSLLCFLAALLVYAALRYLSIQTLISLGIVPSGAIKGTGPRTFYPEQLFVSFAPFVSAYTRVFTGLFAPHTYHMFVVAGINIIITAWAAWQLTRSKRHASSMLLLTTLLLLLPIAINLSEFLSRGHYHELMGFTFALLYVLPIALVERFKPQSCRWRKTLDIPSFGRAGLALSLGLIALSNAIYAHHLYLQRELSYQSKRSIITQMINDIEHTAGYESNVTPVCFVGNTHKMATNIARPNFEHIHGFGIDPNDALWLHNAMDKELSTVLAYPMKHAYANPELKATHGAEVERMPCFPQRGYCRKIGDTLFVKLAEWED